MVISDTSFIDGDDCHLGIDNIKYLIEKYNTKTIATHMRDITRKELLDNPVKNLEVEEDFYTIDI